MIEISQISKSFGPVRALRDVSFTAGGGTICGLLGPNGAGKSTLFKILMGLLPPDSGTCRIAGTPITFGETAYKQGIGYAPENPVFFDYLTGRQFLAFIAAAKAVPPGRRENDIRHWLSFFTLQEKADELIVHYSQGMRRKLSLAAAFTGDPGILILDEATNGLDPESSYNLKQQLRAFCKAGKTVLFSTHIIEVAEQLCDRIVILHRGERARELHRDEWLAFRKAGTSLEQEFIRIVQQDPARDSAASRTAPDS